MPPPENACQLVRTLRHDVRAMCSAPPPADASLSASERELEAAFDTAHTQWTPELCRQYTAVADAIEASGLADCQCPAVSSKAATQNMGAYATFVGVDAYHDRDGKPKPDQVKCAHPSVLQTQD